MTKILNIPPREPVPSPGDGEVGTVKETAPVFDMRQQRSLWRRKLFSLALFVALPTALSAVYYGVIAADQFQTEVLISVRSAQGSPASSFLGTVLGMGNISQSAIEANTVSQFIISHDAVTQLDEELDLRTIYSRPKIDYLARMSPDASLEELVEYYKGKVKTSFDSASGITTIKVRAFRREDAQAIAAALIRLSENLINSFNRRAEEDTLHLARSELARAEDYITAAREHMMAFRLKHREIDPTISTGAVGEIIAGLEMKYAETATKLGEIMSYMNPNSLQVEAVRKQLRALEDQISQEQQRLTGDDSTMTAVLAEYEGLVVENELANLAYTSAITSLESARIEAQRQRSYVVPVVFPHAPEEAEYPRKLRGIFFVLIGSLIVYGIGRLLIFGVRDHVLHD